MNEGEQQREQASGREGLNFLSSRHAAAIATLNEVLTRVDDLSIDPQVAYICGNLFFSEIVEAIQPMVMAGSCLAIYYSPFADNCRFFTFMNSVSEDLFLRGMQFVWIEGIIQFSVSILVFVYLRDKMNVDVFRVGSHILKKNRLHFWYMSFFTSLYFLASFLQHLGPDSYFEFAWLFNNATYVPLDAEEGNCQIFNIEPVDGGQVLASCMAGDTEESVVWGCVDSVLGYSC